MTVLVDSDILIEVSRAKDARIVAKWLELSESSAAILYSPVSVAELWAGAKPNEHNALHNLFRSSHAVEIEDALIAACAVESHSQLWTRNRKHYPMKELSFFTT